MNYINQIYNVEIEKREDKKFIKNINYIVISITITKN